MTGAVDREVRADVSELLVRYATGIDTRDWVLFRTCFTEDCEADYGSIGAWHNLDELTEWMRATHEPVGITMHRISNVAVMRDGVETDGKGSVTARSYVDAIVMFADNEAGTRTSGFYDDELVNTNDSWKIAKRRFTLVMLQLYPEGKKLEI